MPIAKKNSANITPNDGRKHNGRKVGTKVAKPKKVDRKLTPAKLNKAKKDRMKVYAVNAIRSVYDTEEEFWVEIARKAKDNFNYAKMITEYAYGKPQDETGEGGKSKAPVINFYTNNNIPQIDNTIDIDHKDEDRSTLKVPTTF